MFARTAVRRFAATRLRLARSPYTVFMMENKKHPALAGLKVAARGKATAKLYKALSASERASLVARAAKLPAFKRAKKPAKKASRKPSAYNKFIGKAIKNAPGKTQADKFKAAVKMWKARN